MRMEDLKALAEDRTKGSWHKGHSSLPQDRMEIYGGVRIAVCSPYYLHDAKFIVACENNIDALIKIAEAAKRLYQLEDSYPGYDRKSFDELRLALHVLESGDEGDS